jgi:hypothetical protein
MINLTITRIETLASDDSTNLKFNQIYKKKIVTFMSPNRFSMKIYYMINLVIFILWYKY